MGWRALRLACPQCGQPGAFESWFRMRPRCSACGLDFDRREDGYVVGGYMLNIVAAEFFFVSGLLVVLAVTWPDPPWSWLRVAAPVLMLGAPLLTYPFTKVLFLAMDLAFRPRGAE